MWRETVYSQSYATFFRHSAVLSVPAVLWRKLPFSGLDDNVNTTAAVLLFVFTSAVLLAARLKRISSNLKNANKMEQWQKNHNCAIYFQVTFSLVLELPSSLLELLVKNLPSRCSYDHIKTLNSPTSPVFFRNKLPYL